MLILVFVPVYLAIYYRISGTKTPMEPGMALSFIMMFFLQFLSVLVALFYATALVADEIDNKTITYLFTRPVRKYSIILGKFAADMVEVLLLLVPAMLITFIIIATDNRILSDFASSLSIFAKRFGVIILSLITYGAIFMFFGVWWKRPVLIGLIFAFGWEKAVLVVPGAIRKFSVIHYLMSAFPGGDRLRMGMPKQLFPNSSPSFSIFLLIVIAVVFMGLSIFLFSRKEYKFE
jgi:ABC-2 type transport system permease protein